MPLPSPSKREEKSKFISRCISDLTKRGEGKDTSQRVAICNSRWARKSKANLTQDEIDSLSNIISSIQYGTPIRKKKKRKKKNG